VARFITLVKTSFNKELSLHLISCSKKKLGSVKNMNEIVGTSGKISKLKKKFKELTSFSCTPYSANLRKAFYVKVTVHRNKLL